MVSSISTLCQVTHIVTLRTSKKSKFLILKNKLCWQKRGLEINPNNNLSMKVEEYSKNLKILSALFIDNLLFNCIIGPEDLSRNCDLWDTEFPFSTYKVSNHLVHIFIKQKEGIIAKNRLTKGVYRTSLPPLSSTKNTGPPFYIIVLS